MLKRCYSALSAFFLAASSRTGPRASVQMTAIHAPIPAYATVGPIVQYTELTSNGPTALPSCPRLRNPPSARPLRNLGSATCPLGVTCESSSQQEAAAAVRDVTTVADVYAKNDAAMYRINVAGKVLEEDDELEPEAKGKVARRRSARRQVMMPRDARRSSPMRVRDGRTCLACSMADRMPMTGRGFSDATRQLAGRQVWTYMIAAGRSARWSLRTSRMSETSM